MEQGKKVYIGNTAQKRSTMAVVTCCCCRCCCREITGIDEDAYTPPVQDFDVTAWKEPILAATKALVMSVRRIVRRRETKGNRGHFNFKKI